VDFVGTSDSTLIVIRGNSGAGKSTIAREVRLRYGRGCALVEQDYLRRIVLRERDEPGGVAPALIEQTVRFALDHGYHVVLEGILHASRYGAMVDALRRAHRGRTQLYYLDVSLPETLRRHETRPQASEFTAEEMRGWYQAHDVLRLPEERIIPEVATKDEVVALITAAAWVDPLPSGACAAGSP
jgi:hypothetical protein